MTHLDMEMGQQARFELKRAILLYKDQHYTFATIHDVASSPARLEPGRLLTLENVHELHRELCGDAHLELLPENVLACSPHKLVWFETAKKRVMFFDSSDTFLQRLSGQTFPHPALLFCATLRSLNVFALAADERPSSTTKLYAAPYFNTTRANVCLGTTALPTQLKPSETAAYSEAFFASAFTHGTNERLLRGWGGSYGEFWSFVKNQKRFPTKYLVPFGQTLGETL
jgi:PRTRC genetic system protein B